MVRGTKKKTAKDLIRSAKLPEKSVSVCLHADLVAEHEAADRELKQERDRPSKKLDDGGKVRELSDRIAALEAEMAEHTIEFRLRAMPRPKWKAFIAAYPPRKTDDGAVDERDQFVGVNVDTFFDPLIRASVVDPELDEEDWRILFGDTDEQRAQREAKGEPVEDGKLTDRQFDTLADAAWALNRHGVDVPFSRAASRGIPNSEAE